MVGVIAALTMVCVLLFLTEPLRYLPVAALGAVLIVAAIGLFDVVALHKMWRVSPAECILALFTMFGVIWLDLLHGILLAVVMALLILIKRASRPADALLGRVPGMKGWHEQAHHEDGKEDAPEQGVGPGEVPAPAQPERLVGVQRPGDDEHRDRRRRQRQEAAPPAG